MLFVLSPAKTLDLSPAPVEVVGTRPELTTEANRLAAVVKRLKAADLRRLMDVSESLADLNVQRHQSLDLKKPADAAPAALMFAGDVYVGLDARSLDLADLEWSQDRLRILSGLYGVLRPLDLIQPYRLEMGVRLATDRGATLYDFWGDRLAKALKKAAQGHEDPTIVNLASQEYFGAVDARALKAPVVTCVFREERDGLSRTLSFFAKRARGLMARYAILNRLESAHDLKSFDVDGYRFDQGSSTATEWVFSRPQPEPKAAAAQTEDAAL